MNTKRNPISLFVLATAMILVFGLLFMGCGQNRAQDSSQSGDVTATDAAATLPVEESAPSLAEREADLIVREQVLVERLERLDEVLEEAEKREPTVAEQEAPAEPQPAAGPVDVFTTVMLPGSTALELELDTALSSETSLAGDPVRAYLIEDVIVDGIVAVPAGTRVLGAVIDAAPARKIGGKSVLAIGFDRLALSSGESVAIAARLEAEGKPQKKKDAATIGGSAAGGAVLGHVLGGDDKTRGAVLGAVVGAAIGTAVAAKNKTDPVVIEAGMTATVLLDFPVEIVVNRGAPAGAAYAMK